MAHPLDDVTPLVWRAGRPDDGEAVTTLVAAINYFDDPAETYTADEIRAYFDRDDDALDQLLLGWEGDSLVAMAWNLPVRGSSAPRVVRLTGGVHPAYRHQGIGRRLFAEQWQLAVDTHQASSPGEALLLVAYADAKLGSKRSLYTHGGMTELRRFLDMRVRLVEVADTVAAALARPAPDGVRYVPWDDAYCESCRDAHNEAFAEMWQARPVGEEEWHAQTRRAAARPEWSWLAVDADDRVVGYALNSDASGGHDQPEGWTDRLGVRPARRGRGIATGLLARSLDAFARGGADAGGLGLDTRGEPDLGLYRSLGYTASDTIVQYACEVAPDAGSDGNETTKGR